MIPDHFLEIKSHSGSAVETYKPIVFKLGSNVEYNNLLKQLSNQPNIQVIDTIASQIRELIKLRNPSRFNDEVYATESNKFCSDKELWQIGNWIFYPWLNKLVHVLDKEEFIEIRTNRNKLKINDEQQRLLSGKTIGVIGLSVGQSVALTLCMERCCGSIKLSDFDDLELSNLNRLRTGIHNLGLKKTIIAAREIAEIDPYIEVEIFNEGVTHSNMNEFFSGLDLLVEVCDNIQVKISSRVKAREMKIPVLMDTNDRGMIDIERFDLEPGRELLHGLIKDEEIEKLAGYTDEERMRFIFRIISYENTSEKLKHSMMQINKTITSWPQLASSVVLGGAVTTDVARRILLNELQVSGRFYVDFDQIIN